ncbi:ldehyde dehydrogenase [Diaporthe amygdali]|uniref:ldehyde dehydrogenase n=1 Tax=Phomopsis amygdali TaxID=1214568 RepID=UPI0022FF0B22|nr:ldehyde dehydrogenase [Diaporthe amygdali]KAJ0120461.1 ldehyde dehydrogenase [Diaporthe amygdali]
MATNGQKTNGTTQFHPRMLINGELVEASDKKTFTLYNPATTGKLADVPEATADDANAAVASAKAAFPSWSETDPAKRGSYLKKLASLIQSHNEELAILEAQSMGKPVTGFFDAHAAASKYEHYAAAWPQIKGESSLNTPGHISVTFRQPYGVVAVIIPWNVPLLFFASKSAPALIAGNTVVLKTSEKAPLAAAKVAELIKEAGFPPGVFNVISGHGNPSGSVLSSHMDVRALSFTGSARTGRLIQEAAAKSNLKKVILELGGKSPALIFEDADLNKAVVDTSHSIQTNSGQVCMANSRVYVQKSVAPKFIEAFQKKFAHITAGDPTKKETDHGPQADGVQYSNVMKYIEEGKSAGGSLAMGGNGKLDSLGGYFIEPTVFLDTPEDSKFMKEEIFGPVVNISTFETEEEAIKVANDTEFGLYAAVYTKDIDRAMRVAKALESGYVGVNCTSPSNARDMPFGGYKSSGQGREGGNYSLDNFLEVKTVLIELGSRL